MADPDQYRLPRHVEPERYDLEMRPDLATASFRGRARIAVKVAEPVTQVVLNAAELEVRSARVPPAGGGGAGTGGPAGEGQDTRVSFDEVEERLILDLDRELAAGRWVIEIDFAGVLNDKLRGFYRSTFTDEQGEERVIATTQFEATDARRAFPCWDEPDRKAVFGITLVIDEGLTAFSNSAEVQRSHPGEGKVAVRFADTMAMSTYLVAFVVGPLVASPTVDAGGVPLRIVHVPGREDLCGFAQDIGAHALGFFSAWFGIDYPAGKLDLIGLPDFAAGAMENLGAVTFRENLLLLNPATAAQVERERVADVVAHEIAHMWFGDLVTMKWWNGLWLNEAFATFMEMLCVDDFRPEWNRWVTFGLSRGAALATDALHSTRPIEFPVGRPEEAEGMFDVLTYEKGAAVLRMLERYLGAEEFRQGIRLYIETHAYGNAETTDLWDGIETATGQPVRSIMDSWIFQAGYPLVSVTEGEAGRVQFDQQRFLLSGGAPEPVRWSIPLLLRASVDGVESSHRLLLDSQSTEFDLGGKPDWVIANAGGSGFYRVRYDGALAAALRSDLGRLDALELFNLVSDTWAATLAGQGDLSDLAELVRLLRGDEDPAVWALASSALDFVHRVADQEGKTAVEAFVRQVFSPAFAETGWSAVPGEPETRGTLRASLLGALGTTGADPDVRARAVSLHDQVMADRSAADADLVGALVGIVAAVGDSDQYRKVLSRFKDPATPQEEIRYLYALAGFRHQDLVRRTVEMALSGEVRTQNSPFLINLAIANRVAGAEAWEMLKASWDDFTEKIPQNTIVRMVDNVALLATPEQAGDVHRFFEDHPLRSSQKTLEQILERLDVNTAFARRQRDLIRDIF
jgi:puromycin-sensitive aminopeptidase